MDKINSKRELKYCEYFVTLDKSCYTYNYKSTSQMESTCVTNFIQQVRPVQTKLVQAEHKIAYGSKVWKMCGRAGTGAILARLRAL